MAFMQKMINRSTYSAMKSADSQRWRRSKFLIILVVSMALYLDCIIMTVVVPILPALLYEIDHPNQLQNETVLGEYNNTDTEKTTNETQQNIYMQESADVGFMLASKSIVQLIVNPIVGSLTDKVGCLKIMFAGLVVMFASTFMFAIGNTYAVLLFARASQGIGSSCATVAGLALLAKTFPDEIEREKAMAIAFTGLSFGLGFGLPFGGIMDQLVNKSAPFLIICLLTALDGCLLLFIKDTSDGEKKEDVKPPPIFTLIKDKYILSVAGGIFIFNIALAFLETGLPIWMMDTMYATELEIGLILASYLFTYIVGVNISAPILKKTGKWQGSVVSLLLFGVAFIGMSVTRNKIVLLLPLIAIGLFSGVSEISLFPELSHIVDVRYTSAYGNAYAIADIALSLGFGIGPILCGMIMSSGIGFDYVALVCGIVCILYSPLLAILKNVDNKEEEKQPLIDS